MNETAASGEGISVSEWVRALAMSRFGLDHVGSGWSAPTTLSKPIRQQLALLHELLAQVSADEEIVVYHARRAEVLQHGYTGEYAEEFIAFADEMPMSDCRLVWDVLDMFRVIEASVRELGNENISQTVNPVLKFRGFDFQASREGHMSSYVRYLIQGGRWVEFADRFDADHDNGNSHMPVLDIYLRMLEVFQTIWNSNTFFERGRSRLDEDELVKIAAAAIHPDNR